MKPDLTEKLFLFVGASILTFVAIYCLGFKMWLQVKKTTGANPSSSQWKDFADLKIPSARKEVWIHTRKNVWKVIKLP